ncbi:MAG: hypothetical protein GX758_01365 [Tenericutes bacterium]|nr:hypothetical protein [Mycoplasmatota bacterium]
MNKKIELFITLIFVFMFVGTINVNAVSKEVTISKIGTSGFAFASSSNNATKTTYSIPKIKATAVSTALTDPCSSCILAVRTYETDESGWYALGSTIKLNQEKSFIGHDGSASPGTYKLGAQRADFTILKTTATFYWTYD